LSVTIAAQDRRGGGARVATYAALLSIVSLAGLGALAVALAQPLVFPSVGPTVMVLAERPGSASAHPRNVLAGHLVGVAAGVASLLLFNLWHSSAATLHGITPARVGAAALSLTLTAFFLQVLHAPHAPAGAATLIVSLGLMKSVPDLLAILAAIAFVTVVATVSNRLTGKRTRLDKAREPTTVPTYIGSGQPGELPSSTELASGDAVTH